MNYTAKSISLPIDLLRLATGLNDSEKSKIADALQQLATLLRSMEEAEARDRVAIALREPNSAKAAQVASSLGASRPSQPSTGVPKGWRLVPIASNGDMNQAAVDCNSSHGCIDGVDAQFIWDAMLAAAPRSP